MIHITNFGKFSQPLLQFADINGLVPQAVDEFEKMTYARGDFSRTPDGTGTAQWEEFRGRAIAATQACQQELEDWQEGKRKPGPALGSGKYGAGGGAKKLSARIEEVEVLEWISAFPGGTAGVLRAAYANRKRLKI